MCAKRSHDLQVFTVAANGRVVAVLAEVVTLTGWVAPKDCQMVATVHPSLCLDRQGAYGPATWTTRLQAQWDKRPTYLHQLLKFGRG
jgi:hypothetical protein